VSNRNAVFRWVIIMIFAIAELTATVRVSFAQTLVLGQSGASSAGFSAESEFETWQIAQAIIDVEPPLIEHEIVAESDANIRQTFVATVVDDQELDRVQLFYRFKGETRYTRTIMDRVSFSSTWIAQIATDPSSPQDMEYYIQAKDKSGNRTVRGYAFSPLVRKIIPSVNVEAPVEEPPVTSKPPTSTTQKVLYVLGGVLVVGLIASLSSNGTGPEPPDPTNCPGGLCTVTISTVRPF